MDRISNLPDEIIGHIGSFFSAKEAAFTALLSKRWQNLYENLFHLSIPAQQSICWIGSQVLLNKYPNLKTITIKGSLHYKDDDRGNVESVCECLEGYTFLSSCSIEVLKITECKGDIGEMVQIKHMLEKLPSLEILVVHLKPKRDDTKLQITVDLLMLPRYSSKCKIWVKHSLTKS